MFLKKLFVLSSYGLIIGYRGEPFPVLIKILDPLMLIIGGRPFGMFCALILFLVFNYLFFSSLVKPYHQGKSLSTFSVFMLVLSVLMEFRGFSFFSLFEKVYFAGTTLLFLWSSFVLLRTFSANVEKLPGKD